VHFYLQLYYLIYLVITLLCIILFLHLLSTNHKCTQPCYFPCCTNLLLRRWRWTAILRRGVLGCVLPWLLFLWCYGGFHLSISLESRLVFKDIICVINILYSWHLAICEHFLSVCAEWMIMGAHVMDTWFCLQNQVWHLPNLRRWRHGPPRDGSWSGWAKRVQRSVWMDGGRSLELGRCHNCEVAKGGDLGFGVLFWWTPG
jgi:hypothetical protein